MRMLVPAAAAMALSCLVAPAARADSRYDACVDAAGAVMPDLGDCGAAWVEREDRRLNAAWTILMTKVDADTKASLLAEQRAWIAFKDKACEFYVTGDYGQNGQMLDYPACRAEVIAQRTAALKAYGQSIDPQ